MFGWGGWGGCGWYGAYYYDYYGYYGFGYGYLGYYEFGGGWGSSLAEPPQLALPAGFWNLAGQAAAVTNQFSSRLNALTSVVNTYELVVPDPYAVNSPASVAEGSSGNASGTGNFFFHPGGGALAFFGAAANPTPDGNGGVQPAELPSTEEVEATETEEQRKLDTSKVLGLLKEYDPHVYEWFTKSEGRIDTARVKGFLNLYANEYGYFDPTTGRPVVRFDTYESEFTAVQAIVRIAREGALRRNSSVWASNGDKKDYGFYPYMRTEFTGGKSYEQARLDDGYYYSLEQHAAFNQAAKESAFLAELYVRGLVSFLPGSQAVDGVELFLDISKGKVNWGTALAALPFIPSIADKTGDVILHIGGRRFAMTRETVENFRKLPPAERAKVTEILDGVSDPIVGVRLIDEVSNAGAKLHSRSFESAIALRGLTNDLLGQTKNACAPACVSMLLKKKRAQLSQNMLKYTTLDGGTTIGDTVRLMREGGLKGAAHGGGYKLDHLDILLNNGQDTILWIKPRGAGGKDLYHAVLAERVFRTGGGTRYYQIVDPADARRWLVPEDELVTRFSDPGGWLIVPDVNEAKKLKVVSQ